MAVKRYLGVRNIALIVMALLFVLLLILSRIHTESLVVPAWTVQVIDKSGNPVEGASVSQTWQDYSVESHSHDRMIVTGKDGKASFSERVLLASQLARVLGPLRSVLRSGFHAGRGPSSWIIARMGDCTGGNAIYKQGEKLPETVVIDRLGSCK